MIAFVGGFVAVILAALLGVIGILVLIVIPYMGLSYIDVNIFIKIVLYIVYLAILGGLISYLED